MNTRLLAATLAASLAAAASAAGAAPSQEPARVASQYASWAGSRANAESLVAGMRNGNSITIVTTAPDRTVSLAGFTPPRRMSDGEISHALSEAQRTLARLGIQRPTAEQIQAALIGGEVSTREGRLVSVRGPLTGAGSVAAR